MATKRAPKKKKKDQAADALTAFAQRKANELAAAYKSMGKCPAAAVLGRPAAIKHILEPPDRVLNIREATIKLATALKNPAAVALGRRGGQSTSPAKVAARRGSMRRRKTRP
jgi:hypothetical protein